MISGRWEIMEETRKDVQVERSPVQEEQEKLKSVQRADAAVKSMSDFTSP